MSIAPEMLDPRRYASLGELLDDALLTFKSETALIEVDRKNAKVLSRLGYTGTFPDSWSRPK